MEKRVKVTNRRRWGWPGFLVRATGVVGLVASIATAYGGFLAYAHFAQDLPDVAEVRSVGSPTVTQFYTSEGQLAGEWYRERRILLRWDQLPKRLILAFLAAEDARFFGHHGVDFRGIARATWQNLKAGGVTSGASTITQQLAKTIIGAEKSLERKAREAIMARRMEDVFSKQEILLRYLNSIYLGYHSYGVQAAAQNYFSKDISQLSLAEMATLAGLPVAPSVKNPVANMDQALGRMNYVLGQMERWGWVTNEEASQARREGITLKLRANPLTTNVPYYTELVRQEVQRTYGVGDDPNAWMNRGLQVHMHVDSSYQHAARDSLSLALEELGKKQGYAGALGSMEAEAFLSANARWLSNAPPEPGERLLARVTKVTRRKVGLQLGEGVHGSFKLKSTRWAAKYRRFRQRKKGGFSPRKVSFREKLKDFRKAFKVGDVVLVDVGKGPPDDLELSLVAVPLVEGALSSLDNVSGHLDVAVGGWDFERSQVNRVYSLRQTGSVIKPIIYSKAYDMGLAPSTIFSGAPFREGKYNPTGRGSHRDMTAWDALTFSKNPVSLRILKYVLNRTDARSYDLWGQRLGLTHPLKGNTAEALGGNQTVLGIARAFGTFARQGRTPTANLIRKVVDPSGRVLERHISPLNPHSTTADSLLAMWDKVLSPPGPTIPASTAYLTTANMLQVVKRGTGKAAKKLEHVSAGKTGTLMYDVWYAGFTRSRTAVAWVGADRMERSLGRYVTKVTRASGVTGSNTALPAWMGFMERLDKHRPQRDLPADKVPKDVEHYRIDAKNGLLLPSGGLVIPHRLGTEPDEFSVEAVSPDNIEELEGEF